MQLHLGRNEVADEESAWFARLIDLKPFRGVPLAVVDTLKTGGNALTNYDVLYYMRNGQFPGPDRLALHPAWGFPYPAKDMTADRKEFHEWRAGRYGVPGRKLVLSYGDARLLRNARTFAQATTMGIRTITGEPLNYETYRTIATGRNYWWVNSGNDEWMGWFWRGVPNPEVPFEDVLRSDGGRAIPA